MNDKKHYISIKVKFDHYDGNIGPEPGPGLVGTDNRMCVAGTGINMARFTY